MEIAVHMMVRNEVDVIKETILEMLDWGEIDHFIVMDGGSDDGTIETVKTLALDFPVLKLHVVPDPDDKFVDHQRQVMLDLTRDCFTTDGPHWIISLDADEIYDTDPIEAVLEAESAGANVVWQDIPQFWITVADVRAGLLVEKPELSVQKRRRWYSWGHTGCFIWKDDPHHFYPFDVSKRTPEWTGIPNFREWQIPGPIRPICKHYCFRSLDQAMKRMHMRLRHGGHKYFGKYKLNWLIDEEAVGLVKRLGDYEPWVRIPTHRKVHRYMAGEL